MFRDSLLRGIEWLNENFAERFYTAIETEPYETYSAGSVLEGS